jgi:transcriptional regulator with XRE-family HTH domain
MSESIGQQLGAARRARSLTIEDVAHKTNIHRDVVRRLEEDDHAAFPNLMFVKSFLKIYSEHIDVDASQAIAQLADADTHHGGQYLLGGINPAIRERFGHLSIGIPVRPILATVAAAAVLSVGGSYLVSHLYGASWNSGAQEVQTTPAVGVKFEAAPDLLTKTSPAKVSDPERSLVPKTQPKTPEVSTGEPIPAPAIPKASPVIKRAQPVTDLEEAKIDPDHATGAKQSEGDSDRPRGEYEPFVVTPGIVTPEE